MTTPRRQLREGHAHIAAHGQALSMLNLHECTSVEECLDQVAGDLCVVGHHEIGRVVPISVGHGGRDGGDDQQNRNEQQQTTASPARRR